MEYCFDPCNLYLESYCLEIDSLVFNRTTSLPALSEDEVKSVLDEFPTFPNHQSQQLSVQNPGFENIPLIQEDSYLTPQQSFHQLPQQSLQSWETTPPFVLSQTPLQHQKTQEMIHQYSNQSSYLSSNQGSTETTSLPQYQRQVHQQLPYHSQSISSTSKQHKLIRAEMYNMQHPRVSLSSSPADKSEVRRFHNTSKYPEAVTTALKNNIQAYPRMSLTEKRKFYKELGLTPKQVTQWYCNIKRKFAKKRNEQASDMTHKNSLHATSFVVPTSVMTNFGNTDHLNEMTARWTMYSTQQASDYQCYKTARADSQPTIKQKPKRTTFTKAQLSVLETRFQKDSYISIEERHSLAEELELNSMSIKTWFKNRRILQRTKFVNNQ